MTRGLSKVVPVALLAILGAAVTACGGGPTSTAAPSPTATVTVSADPQSAAAATHPTAPKDPRDKLACDATETVMARMSKAAAGWMPGTHPFDAIVGARIRALTVDMTAAQRLSGTAPVRDTLMDNTAAFTTLAKAMAGTRKNKVFGAVGRTRDAYSQFKSVCGVT